METADVLPIAVAFAAGYLIGSVPVAYPVVRAVGVDIREVGTRNPGAANVFRTVSRRLGVVVFTGDVLKGAAAVLIAWALGVPAEWLPVAGAAVIAGQWFPVFMRFRGGAGLAVGIGVALGLSPAPAAVGLAVGVLTIALIHNTTRSAAVGYVALVITSQLMGAGWLEPLSVTAIAGMLLLRLVVVTVLRRWRQPERQAQQ
ncbi:MAG: glycerol-3-phosphate acyltransferase [Dehalococcoidia bacterium]